MRLRRDNTGNDVRESWSTVDGWGRYHSIIIYSSRSIRSLPELLRSAAVICADDGSYEVKTTQVMQDVDAEESDH